MAKAVLSSIMEAPVPGTQTPSFASIDELHLLISEMDDELSKLRWREAIWISVVVHVMLFLAWFFGPRFMPRTAVLLPAPVHNMQTNFLVLPKSLQRTPPPRTSTLSDQNRRAQSPTPLPNKDAIRKILNAQAPGAPRPTAPAPAPQQQQAAQQAPPQQNSGNTQTGGEPEPQNQPAQTAKLEEPPQAKGPSPFKAAMAPGAAIDQAIQAAANGHGASRLSFGGDFGISRREPNSDVRGDVEVLSDTMGVDFGPYLQRVLWEIKTHWYQLVPESALPPMMKKGKLAIQFAIQKDGSVAGMQMVATSSDVALDRAAWGGITHSNPFQPLPAAFKGSFLELRIRFLYNPDKGELE